MTGEDLRSYLTLWLAVLMFAIAILMAGQALDLDPDHPVHHRFMGGGFEPQARLDITQVRDVR